MYFTSASAKLLLPPDKEAPQPRPSRCSREWVLVAQALLTALALLLVLGMPRVQYYTIEHYRPRAHGQPPMVSSFVNKITDYEQMALVTHLSVCHHIADNNAPLQFVWTFHRVNVSQVTASKRVQVVSTDCALLWRADEPGEYSVQVQVTDHNALKDIATAHTTIQVQDLWLAVLGDSFAAGQGNPEFTEQMFGLVQAKWLHERCARSSHSFGYKMYEHLLQSHPQHSILFTYLACSGASARHGLIRAANGQVSQIKQLEELVHMSATGTGTGIGNVPNWIVITIGANDIGFADIMDLLARNESVASLDRMVDRRMVQLRKQMAVLGTRLNSLVQGRSQVHLVEYFSVAGAVTGAESESGAQVDPLCGQTLPLRAHALYMDQVIIRLNRLLLDSARAFGWLYVTGVFDSFQQHALCSTHPFLLDTAQSIERQGNPYGAFHPNQFGHERVYQLLSAVIH